MRWGTAYVSVPTIFGELMLFDVRQCMYELTLKGSSGGISGCEIGVIGQEKGVTCYSFYFIKKI